MLILSGGVVGVIYLIFLRLAFWPDKEFQGWHGAIAYTVSFWVMFIAFFIVGTLSSPSSGVAFAMSIWAPISGFTWLILPMVIGFLFAHRQDVKRHCNEKEVCTK